MNQNLKFVIDRDIPFIKGVLEPFGKVVYASGSAIDNDLVKQANAMIIRTRTRCNDALLEGSTVKIIASATIGMDHIDTNYCDRAGIQYTNAPGCNSGSVMQYMASALVSLAERFDLDLSQLTLGVIGHGNVGSKVVKMARILGMNVLINDPPLERKGKKHGIYCSLKTIQQQADIITLHVPLQMEGPDKTHHLVNEQFISSLSNKVFLINSSRGEVVEELVLKKALKSGLIKGAVLDVLQNEPNIDVDLLDQTAIATPHIAGYSADGKANGTSMTIRAVSSFFDLGLDDWFPENIPLGGSADSIGPKTIEVLTNKLYSIIKHTYDIMDDDRRLRENPALFEKLRAEYPVRREFSAHTIQSDFLDPEEKSKCEALGFRTPA